MLADLKKKLYVHLRFNLFDIKYSTVKLWYIRIKNMAINWLKN